jgi:hypothetical protein
MFLIYLVIFIAGIFTGLMFGFVILALCNAAANGDEMAGYDE